MSDRLDQLFQNLDCWRHLPAYQLERRFDIFLSPYIRDVVAAHVGGELDPVIVPEMPLKQEGTNRSDKVDYVLFSADRRTVYLIELKTDCASERDAQDEYLKRAAGLPWSQVLRNLVDIVDATQSRRKYLHLLHLLARAGQVRLDPQLVPSLDPVKSPRFRREWVTVSQDSRRIASPVYIRPIPRSNGGTCITFADVRQVTRRYDDPLSVLVTRYLQRWECQAGSVIPDGWGAA
jgi:hypothetical protein